MSYKEFLIKSNVQVVLTALTTLILIIMNRQIGWGTQTNLLWSILQELKSIKPRPSTTTTTTTTP